MRYLLQATAPCGQCGKAIVCHAIGPGIDPHTLKQVCGAVALASSTVWLTARLYRQAGGSVPVQTSRGIPGWDSTRKIPEGQTACALCGGSGKICCPTCDGKGRVNRIDRLVLPKGENPVHCLSCRGTTLALCGRCLGTGIKRAPIGFRV
ncbi:hypothetical protein CHLRE_02g091193v5 [Chlamydomonas reinhardtii]|uniref:Uncharacterized protein n=1 Tax=Chlamydomonas reinhardtii TaxID=3055 RepID=A0A2K3E1B8_CHLRE|nr:uncharacterized protein CHLRE_02g091193v5 [Chlamydomonas reinhardtii]PNW86547.1 hypothetical protein CHLRE_02g091193v5 [Chlamydomonas reinhardtii]